MLSVVRGLCAESVCGRDDCAADRGAPRYGDAVRASTKSPDAAAAWAGRPHPVVPEDDLLAAERAAGGAVSAYSHPVPPAGQGPPRHLRLPRRRHATGSTPGIPAHLLMVFGAAWPRLACQYPFGLAGRGVLAVLAGLTACLPHPELVDLREAIGVEGEVTSPAGEQSASPVFASGTQAAWPTARRSALAQMSCAAAGLVSWSVSACPTRRSNRALQNPPPLVVRAGSSGW